MKWLSVELSLLLLVSMVAFAGFVNFDENEAADYSESNDLTGEASWYKPRPPVYAPLPQPAPQGLSLQQKQEVLELLSKATVKSGTIPNNPPGRYKFSCNETCGDDKRKCISAFGLFANSIKIPFDSPQPIYTAMPLSCDFDLNVFHWLKTNKWFFCTCV